MAATLAFCALALALGAAMAVQSALNAEVARASGSGAVAAGLSFAVGLLTLVGLVLVRGQAAAAASVVREVSPAWWIGAGLLGAFIVSGIALAVPRLGASAAMAISIAAQLATAAAIDHWGLLGVEQHSFSWLRALGVLLLLLGAALIQFF